ncbi:MAG: DUF3347 domain-containing protein [Bacteroidota bacterium]|nr:DUF3347 domain-containing protein [Bacteroidota bacterium]
MKSLFNLILVPTLLLSTSCNGQIKNIKTLSLKIDGNCKICEKTIETAANKKNIAKLVWDKNTKTASVSFDATKTSEDEILKRIALAGYDNEKFLAPDKAYGNLPECCKYDRARKKTEAKSGVVVSTTDQSKITNTQNTSVNQLKIIFDSYFDLKNSLVKTDNKSAIIKAENLSSAISKIEMNKLEGNQHAIWMKVYKDLVSETNKVAKSNNIEEQRMAFIQLSEKIYELIKVANFDFPVYYQHCPMYNDNKGANWLSLESSIKNPYYGSQMLSCGKTLETIK